MLLTPEQQAQMKEGGGRRGKGGWEKFNITPEQKEKIEQLRASSRAEMDAILTPEQQAQAKTYRERRQAMGGGWKSLNLTAEQKEKIRTIRQSSQLQFTDILTPEQQAKLKDGKSGKRRY